MKILVLGVGAVGEVIVKHLTDNGRISLTVADVDEARLRRVKRKVKERKLRTEKINMGDAERLEEIIKDHELLVNAATPDINLMLMNSCLKHGVNYIDLASDEIDEQLSLDRKYKSKEIMAIICLGEDPGLSNIYARYAADRLDKVHEIKIRDGEVSKSRKYPLVALFSPEVFFDEILSPSYIYVDGRYKKLSPFSGYELYEFPEPLGRQPVYSVAHEEVFTLPKFIKKGVRYVDFKLSLSDELIQAIKLLRRIGLLRARKVPVKGTKVAPKDVFFALMPKPSEVSRYIEGHAALVVEVTGESEKREVTYTMYTLMSHEEAYRMFRANATAYLTGTVPAVIAGMIAKGKIEGGGVMVPEQLEPEPIIEEIAEKKIVSYLETSEEGVMPMAE